MKRYLLLVLLLSNLLLLSQNQSLIDSLENKVGTTSGKEKFYILSDLCWEYCYPDIEKSFEYSTKEIELAKKLNNDTLLAIAYNDHGRSFQRLGNYDTTLQLYKKSLSLRRKLKDSMGIGATLSKMATIYNWLGDLESAILSNQKCLDIFEALHDSANYYFTLGNIAHIKIKLGDFKNVKQMSEEALAFFERNNIPRGSAVCLGNLSYYHEHNLDYEKSNECMKKSIELWELYDAQSEIAALYNNIAYNYSRMNNSKLALENYKKALKIVETLNNNEVDIAMYNGNVGSAYVNIDEPNKALPYYEKSFALAKKNNRIDTEIKCLKGFYDVFKHSPNKEIREKGFQFLEKHILLKDSLYDADKLKNISELEMQYETEKKEKELLISKSEKAEAELKVSEKSKQIWLLIGSALLIFLAGGFLFYRNRKKQQSKLATIRIEEQQKGLSAVIQAQEEERKRIAKDLHDGIVQQLGGLKLGLQSIFSGKENEETEKAVKILDDSANELRELSHKMMPRSLSEVGLIPSINDMLENSLGNTSIEYQFEHFGIKSRFKEKIEIAIYRISQELINNVIKHSKANKVNIQLFKTGKNLVLIVEDNGKGIENKGKEGIGLMNIASRLDTINGNVNFEPSPDSGTLATVKIPVE